MYVCREYTYTSIQIVPHVEYEVNFWSLFEPQHKMRVQCVVYTQSMRHIFLCRPGLLPASVCRKAFFKRVHNYGQEIMNGDRVSAI